MIDYNYVSVRLSPEDTAAIYDLLLDKGVSLEVKYELHATVMYGVNEGNVKLTELDNEKEFKAFIIGTGLLGPDDKKAYTLLLSSKDIHDEHKRLKEVGYKHSFDDFIPHLTLAYDVDKFTEVMLNSLTESLIGMELTLINLSFGEKQDE